MKADLHLHSRFSERPAHWLLKRLGCNESYTDPRDAYRIARARGMTCVTLTDHNTIGGCLEIADLPDTFVSEEVTSYFPDDRCKVHVLVYGIAERHHDEIQMVRESVFDLVAYLRAEGIVHALAHPLFPVNDKLTPSHVERLLLLFKTIELNGDQHAANNAFLRRLASRLTPETIERLAARHGIEPTHPEPWRKHLVGGSDDHSSLHIARAWTEVEGAATPAELLDGIARGTARVVCRSASPRETAHGIYGIAYQHYRQRLGGGKRPRRDAVTQVLDAFLTPEPHETPSAASRLRWAWDSFARSFSRPSRPYSLLDVFKTEGLRQLAQDDGFLGRLRAMRQTGGTHNAWFHLVTRISSGALAKLGEHVLDSLLGGRVFDLFHSLGSAGAVSFGLAPYIVAFSMHARERRLGTDVRERFLGEQPGDGIRIADFTDAFHDDSPVARGLERRLEAARTLGLAYGIVTCSGDPEDGETDVARFAPIGTYQLPDLPDLTLAYPPFLEMLDHCYRAGVTHLHAATPGPLGLAAAAIARILQIPLIASYRPELARDAQRLTDDGWAEDIIWRYLAWFHGQADLVAVPSQAAGRQLAAGGVDPAAIRLLPVTHEASPAGPEAGARRFWQLCGEATRLHRARAAAAPAGLAGLLRAVPAGLAAEGLSPVAPAHVPGASLAGI